MIAMETKFGRMSCTVRDFYIFSSWTHTLTVWGCLRYPDTLTYYACE